MMSSESLLPAREATPDSYDAGVRWLAEAFYPILIEHPFVEGAIARWFRTLSPVEQDGLTEPEFVRDICAELWQGYNSYDLGSVRGMAGRTPHASMRLSVKRLIWKRYRGGDNGPGGLGDYDPPDPVDDISDRIRDEHLEWCIRECLALRTNRDQEIIRFWLAGQSQVSIAEVFGLRPPDERVRLTRVNQIISKFKECVTDKVKEGEQ